MKHPTQLPEVEPVVLKPILGIKPGIYLLVLYIFIILLVLFFIGFLPGIVKGGRHVTFSSPIRGSGLYIDGNYQGSANYQYFVQSGEHQAEVRKADITISRETIRIDHPVFFTWLVHYTKHIPLSLRALNLQEKEAIVRFDLHEIVRYSAITTYDKVTVYPPLFSNLANDMEAISYEKADQVLALAANFITSAEMLDDAKKIKCNDGLFTKTLDIAIQLFGQDQSQGKTGLPSGDETVSGKRTVLDSGVFTQEGITYSASTVIMGDTVPTKYNDTNRAGIKVTVPPFTIATTPVSQYQWALFIKDNPSFAKSNSEKLSEQDIVDEYYLNGESISTEFSAGKPVFNISYQAAMAFCRWVGQKSGKKVFVPSETQWYIAAISAKQRSYVKSLTFADDQSDMPTAMLGGVWEMTSTPFIPLSRLSDYEKVHQLGELYLENDDIIVKGGSYENNGITRDSVGAIGTNACGDLIGFRVAWMDEQDV